MKKITDYLDKPQLLCQLAEECCELAQAALKLKRAMEGVNPTPMSVRECEADMDEEIGDVELVLNLLGFHSEEHIREQAEIMEFKRQRWENRLYWNSIGKALDKEL